MTRWATFDCYGTLVDWNAGVGGQLTRLLGDDDLEALLHRYHEVEPELQRAEPTAAYRDIMARTLARMAQERGVVLADADRDALGRSLPDWPVFPEVRDELNAARDHGWTLVILSNTDRDLIDASMRAIGVEFERAIVASEIGSYKPAPGHWRAFSEATGAGRAGQVHVHVAQSHFHDIVPATELGIPNVWINRRGERHEPAPTRELPDLRGLADVLDELGPT